MKIGVIVCAYNCPAFVPRCLKPWTEYAALNKEVEIGVVSTQFKGFPKKENEPTMQALWDALCYSKGFIVSNPDPLLEHEARNMPLHYFLEKNFDAVWLVDADEFYTLEQIQNIVRVVEEQPLITWWSIPFKNYVFDGKQWIDGFCPPRIFRTQVGNRKLQEFFWDNDARYVSIDGKTHWDYRELSNNRIPKTKAHVEHITWTHTNGKDKVAYQLEHFGACSYCWNEVTQELEFDLDYYRKTGQPVPEIYADPE